MIRYLPDGKVYRGNVLPLDHGAESYMCSRCEDYYSLRPNMEPTPYCDACAHSLCLELANALDAANDALRGSIP